MKLRILLLVAISLLSAFTAPDWAGPKQKNKKTVEKSLGQLICDAQTRPDGKDCVFYITGTVYSFIPGKRPAPLFGLEGFNIRRRVTTPENDGYFMATRELLFYTDLRTGDIISEWSNPFTKEKNEVFQIHNDPVNSRVRVKDGKYLAVSMDGKREFGEFGDPQEWKDFYVWSFDIFPFYPLPGWDKNYTSAEMFDFYVPKAARRDDKALDIMNSWTRVGPWLPWMKMDKHEGLLVYHCLSKRYESFDALPEKIRKMTQEKYPAYLTAPDKVDPAKPNATSWSVYLEEMKQRQENGKHE
ncbi:MAG: DUF1838 domain-containing protein [Blastocatellia bacterium]|nr:DUF1838 domain-containing protein [Blastocatellia bacterium]